MGAKQHYHLYYCLLPKVYHRELCCYVKQILSIEIITLVLIGTVLPSLDGGGGGDGCGQRQIFGRIPISVDEELGHGKSSSPTLWNPDGFCSVCKWLCFL